MLKAMSHAAIGLNFYSSSSPGHTTSPVIIAFTLGILICFVVGFCFIYLCRCCFMNYLYAWAFHRPTAGNFLHQIHSPTAAGAASPIRGLDPALLQIFPTFPYASVKEFQRKNNNNKKYSLECAICLLEFEEDSVLRLLTVCCHVFHQECIDLWLESHKTCPVCRTDLDSSSKEKRHQENQTIIEQPLTENNHTTTNETRIDVREEEEGEEKEEVSRRREEEEEEFGEGEENNRFSRSHSTGHSIVVIKGEENDDDDDDDENENDEDKYTLKLPEHVQIKLIRGHNYTQSCSSYSEMAKIYSKCCYAEAISSPCTTSSCEPLRV